MDDLQKKTLLDASRCVHIFANGRYFNPKDDRDIRAMVNSVASSYIILHSFDYSLKNLHKPFLDNSLEKFCQCEHPGEQIKTGPPSAAMDGATKDYRPWNPTEYERRAVSRLLRRLGKYYAASCTLVSELVDIVRRTGCGLCIQVQALPFQLSMDIMRTPKVENEYSSVDDFFRRCVTAGMWDLDFKKLEGFCNTWVKQWSSEVLYLHVEMQFALFYALNPDLSPKRNYIGMCGKKCCFCCDFVIRSVWLFIAPSMRLSDNALDICGRQRANTTKSVLAIPYFFLPDGLMDENIVPGYFLTRYGTFNLSFLTKFLLLIT